MTIVSTFTHDGVTFGLDSAGKYWVLTPVPTIPTFTQEESTAEKEPLLKARVSSILMKLGIPPHILGFEYVCTAICLTVTEPEFRISITKTLTPKVAELHFSSPSRVERAMRHAIEHCDVNELYLELFGTEKLVTTKPFIITLANKFAN